MSSEQCGECSLRRACRDSKTSWLFFAVGLVATISMRVIEPLRGYNPMYAKLAWYVGVIGFFLFFVYKYRESRVKAKAIREADLKNKLAYNRELSREEDRLLLELICSQDNKKEQINYFVIFALSLAAVIVALWMDLG